MGPSGVANGHRFTVICFPGSRICHVWQCPILDRCVDDILYSWTIGHRDGDVEKQTRLGKALLSVFVLVDLESDDRGKASTILWMTFCTG